MGDRRRGPRRFRRRLTAAFVLTASVTTGALALATYALTREYRHRNFRETSSDEVRVALALAPRRLDDAAFERILRVYEPSTGSDAVVVDGQVSYSSSASLTEADVPQGLHADVGDQLATATVEADGRDYLVVGGLGPNDERYTFFFSLDQLQDSLAELRTILVGAWIAIVVLSLGIGHLIARRTLRPVREAAIAASAVAAGMLDTRIPADGSDEFGDWAQSFNSMAAALELKIDELRRAAQRERQFTADVAHDLRTPLTGMTAMATLLEEQLPSLPAEARPVAEVLIRDVVRLKHLVLDLLELSRLDAGSVNDAPDVVDLAAAICATIDDEPLPAGVDITVDVPAGMCAVADRRRFRRVLGNVITNAVQHGGGCIAISAAQDHDVITLNVRDRGRGIDPGQMDRIFDRFFRGDSSRTSQGAGLGLAIAREHARAMGGDLLASNAPGGGAQFTLQLPRCEPRDAIVTPSRSVGDGIPRS